MQPDVGPHGAPRGPYDDLPPAPQPKRRSWGVVGAGILLVSAVSGGYVWIQKSKSTEKTAAQAAAEAANRPVPVTAATAERRDVPLYLEGLGNATPLQQVVVHSQVDGRLDKVFFTEGQAIAKGAPLAQIDPRPFDIQLHQAQAGYARDAAQLKNGRVNLERYTAMRDQGIGSQQQVDDQKALVDQYAATIAGDQTAIETARLNLDYAHVVSPLDGVTGIRQVDPGNLVHAADPNGIVVVTQLDPIAIVFSLPQDDYPRLSAALAKGDVQVDAFARDGGALVGSGKLALIDNQINVTTATLKLKAVVPNGDKKLWPNEFVKARVLVSTAASAIVIPAVAVQRGPQSAFVYVVGADSKVAQRPVEIDSLQGELAIVKKGVDVGDVVVTDGANQLKPGSKVSVKKGKSENAPGASSASPSAAPADAPRASGSAKAAP
jgi:multidrug efflux system membrane fusion protein